MKEDADDFLKDVEMKGKLKESFVKQDSDNLLNFNKILIYEYQMDDKNYDIVIHKVNQNYINHYIKMI